ncbi:ABC-2 type transport system ATP-binding protein [Clostridium sp. DSM 8431]|uniref:ABC transporter ATP-binding protein n=1 Tax=Clostridium sp. DSM 8431 TaxID=1761781 RepID=UPI0008E37F93|nr:ABC transporter ATP-binding protein [Clostridium sp. DSM 8431]SFU51153.1 ABC-2 type transport system ATP-binding protein [Clostridium sp. DSM 8431]
MEDVIIDIEGLNKTYKTGKVAVKDVSFQIEKGDIFGFLGPNGAGKTTTIRMMLGLIKPTSGKIVINGKNISRNKADVLRSIGALVEGPAFYNYLSAEENLKIFAAYSGVYDDNKIKSIFKLVGLKGREKDLVSSYSLGMKQRLGIAQSLLNDPEILILDEPTNGLDPEGIKEIRELIIRLSTERKITIMVASHILNEIQKMCNKVIILKRGEVVFQGEASELLSEKNNEYIINSGNIEAVKKEAQNKNLDITNIGNEEIRFKIGSSKPEDLFEYFSGKGLKIREMYLSKNTLEELFFDVVQEDNNEFSKN